MKCHRIWHLALVTTKIVSEYDQEIPQSQTADNPVAPVFDVSNKARLKPVSSATKTSYKIEMSLVASLDMVLSKAQIQRR